MSRAEDAGTPAVAYQVALSGAGWGAPLGWTQLKARLVADAFDNGRTPEQLERSFANSAVAVLAVDGAGGIIGTARALSDGVCNAYIVDVWTYSPYRGQGIARRMLELLLERLPGQHVYLWTDSAPDFYRRIGFRPVHAVGFEQVVGEWLVNG